MLKVIILFNYIIIIIITSQLKNEINQHHNYQCFALHGKYKHIYIISNYKYNGLIVIIIIILLLLLL